jgi:hypothetical protein
VFRGFRPLRAFRVSESSADEELYQQQIEAMARQIDALVVEVYGLTKEEIEIIEASA